MNYHPEKHRRRSIRLKDYDYSQPGGYFVTICTQGRECLFGAVNGEEMKLNDAGQMIWKWWNEIDNKFENGQTDRAIVMPNHFHGIVFIIDYSDVGVSLRGRPVIGNSNNGIPTDKKGQPHGVAPTTLYGIMDWFKTMTTNAYIRGVKQNGWKPFPGKLWQRNYYDRIIRNETELNRIREYIVHNPLKWESDRENPGNWDNQI